MRYEPGWILFGQSHIAECSVIQLSSMTFEEKKLLEEKKELLANITLHGWLCKRGIKGPTADVWRKRYFKVEEGHKLKYYKTVADGPPQGLGLLSCYSMEFTVCST